MNDNRIPTYEFEKAVTEFIKRIPPITEADITLVEQNESLSIIQRFLIKRKLRRIINEQSCNS